MNTNQSFDNIPSPYTEASHRSILFYLSDFLKADTHFYLLTDLTVFAALSRHQNSVISVDGQVVKLCCL